MQVGGPSASTIRVLALAGVLISLSGCLTNFGTSTRFSTDGGDEIEQSNPLAGNGANSSLITLSRVVKSTQAPTANLDLHGDGSNAFAQYCVAQSSGAGQDGPSSCSCNFAFTLSDGTTQNFDVDTLYREDNMIRCAYTSVPQGEVTSMKVKVHLTNVDVYSNELTFRFTGTGISASPTDSSTFLRALRYQCKQALYVPHALDSRVIDPFLSDDGAFALLINFHTTNFGRAMGHFADSSRGVFTGSAQTDRGWICPTTPNDSSFGADLTLYSVQPDSTGNRRIYPPSDPSLDRATFYLAKEMTGVFTVPFNTYTIPYEATTSVAPTGSGPRRLPSIGYGAPPVRATIDGEESCPNSDTPIPSGYKWVKVWSFRGTIPQRSYPTAASLQGISGVSCNPGLWTLQSADGSSTYRAPIIPTCGSNAQQADLAIASAVDNTGACNAAVSLTMGNAQGTVLADRVIWDSSGQRESTRCAKINPGGTTNSSNALGTNHQTLSLGSDTWRRYFKPEENTALISNYSALCDLNTISGSVHAGATSPATAHDDCSSPYNVFNLCGGFGSQGLLSDVNPSQDSDGAPFPADSARRAPASEATPDWSAPYDEANGQILIDSTPIQDFVYVVTPTNVMTRHMLESSDSGLGATYRPYRFYSGGDCSSADPTSPGLRPDGTPDCPENRKIRYQFVNRDQSAVDPAVSGNDPNVVRGYPICALQPINP